MKPTWRHRRLTNDSSFISASTFLFTKEPIYTDYERADIFIFIFLAKIKDIKVPDDKYAESISSHRKKKENYQIHSYKRQKKIESWNWFACCDDASNGDGGGVVCDVAPRKTAFAASPASLCHEEQKCQKYQRWVNNWVIMRTWVRCVRFYWGMT